MMSADYMCDNGICNLLMVTNGRTKEFWIN
jgi:hypothetical protein